MARAERNSNTKPVSYLFKAAVLLFLLSFVAAAFAAPIEGEQGKSSLDERDSLLAGMREEDVVIKRSPLPRPKPMPEPAVNIVKHVKPLCEGPICNHAAFYG